MPLPKPRKDEKEEEFMGRCMSDDTMEKEYPKISQRIAVCKNLYKRK